MSLRLDLGAVTERSRLPCTNTTAADLRPFPEHPTCLVLPCHPAAYLPPSATERVANHCYENS
ncbi:MAG: hypothetical protein WBA43_02570 [Elainellaceae cyanobacterium]